MQNHTPFITELIKTAPPFNPIQRDTILAGFAGLSLKGKRK